MRIEGSRPLGFEGGRFDANPPNYQQAFKSLYDELTSASPNETDLNSNMKVLGQYLNSHFSPENYMSTNPSLNIINTLLNHSYPICNDLEGSTSISNDLHGLLNDATAKNVLTKELGQIVESTAPLSPTFPPYGTPQKAEAAQKTMQYFMDTYCKDPGGSLSSFFQGYPPASFSEPLPPLFKLLRNTLAVGDPNNTYTPTSQGWPAGLTLENAFAELPANLSNTSFQNALQTWMSNGCPLQ